jgi:hypothetical protein
MCFPDDERRARQCAALLLVPTIRAALRQNGVWQPSDQMEFLDSLAEGTPGAEQIHDIYARGLEAGEVVKALWILVAAEPQGAGWKRAVGTIENHSVSRGCEVSVATLWRRLREFAPVLHFWGAWCIRGRRLRSDLGVDYTEDDDLDAFCMEAISLRERLLRWEAKRPDADNKLISDDMYMLWDGWQRPEEKPGWPEMGAVAFGTFGDDVDVPVPGRPGRRKPVSRR